MCLGLQGHSAPKAFEDLPNQQTVDYPSFILVIVGDGGTEFWNRWEIGAFGRLMTFRPTMYTCLTDRNGSSRIRDLGSSMLNC
ncbi:hypothetical protein L6452_33049 [Arctium lappa]|uniref:Uncharacterized protein n=1 Tax=Arctium lappa TaxID=4217 RepID=A0ACB8Z6N9_ARCLA|nr:hypothetical protein L6452_33049 [Arctium lappa]